MNLAECRNLIAGIYFFFFSSSGMAIDQFILNNASPYRVPNIIGIKMRSQSIKNKCISEKDLETLINLKLVPVCKKSTNQLISLVRISNESFSYAWRKDVGEFIIKSSNLPMLDKYSKTVEEANRCCKEKLDYALSKMKDYMNYYNECKYFIGDTGIPFDLSYAANFANITTTLSITINMSVNDPCYSHTWIPLSEFRAAQNDYNSSVQKRDIIRKAAFEKISLIKDYRYTLVNIMSKEFEDVSKIYANSNALVFDRAIYDAEGNAMEIPRPRLVASVFIYDPDAKFKKPYDFVNYIPNNLVWLNYDALFKPNNQQDIPLSYFVNLFYNERRDKKINENFSGFWMDSFDPFKYALSIKQPKYNTDSIKSTAYKFFEARNIINNMMNETMQKLVSLEEQRMNTLMKMEEDIK